MQPFPLIKERLYFILTSHPASQLPVWLDILQEASSLCRVFYGGEQALDHENQLIASLHSDTHIDLTLSIGPGTPADTSHGSSSNPEV